MSKRFTCTEKWDDLWFSELTAPQKLTWLYILDRCDHAGIFRPNIKAMKMYCDLPPETDKAEMLDFLDGRIHETGDVWFIIKFLKFQYPNGLNNNMPVVKSVKKRLKSLTLLAFVSEGLGKAYLTLEEGFANSSPTVKDKDKDKDKDISFNNTSPTKSHSFFNEFERIAGAIRGADFADVAKVLNMVENESLFLTKCREARDSFAAKGGARQPIGLANAGFQLMNSSGGDKPQETEEERFTRVMKEEEDNR